jgi:hypothetical protein
MRVYGSGMHVYGSGMRVYGSGMRIYRCGTAPSWSVGGYYLVVIALNSSATATHRAATAFHSPCHR